MPSELMILVCHAADGHFGEGDRRAVRRVLDDWPVNTGPQDGYEVSCPDGGRLRLHAPGLDGTRAFRRIELLPRVGAWTPDMLNLVWSLMRAGHFGLMMGVDATQFIVSRPQEVGYFPRLLQPPALVRNARDLGYLIGQPVIA